MSITFSIAVQREDGSLRPAYRCDCSIRWCDACDLADEAGQPYPEQFFCDNCTNKDINMANQNAWDFMRWVGIHDGTLQGASGGEIRASDLAVKCRRRLWDEARNHDKGFETQDFKVPGGPRVIMGGRRDGYLRETTERMLALCELAADRWITWG